MHKSKSVLVMCQRDIHMKNEEKKKAILFVYVSVFEYWRSSSVSI